jgi:uncharacterized protein (TIGR02466 family)|tara:strand:+ start:1251 stop:1883 length:633 start_codon:yes stop_codon:yes gene_type:complete
MKFESWFPTVIGLSQCPFIDEVQPSYKKIVENYPVDDYGFINIPVHRKPKFKKLNNWITKEVNAFAKNHNFVFNYEPKESWIWDYKTGSFQEFHTHLGFTISAVFFLEGYQEDSPLVFRSPMHNDIKNPLGTQPHTCLNENLYNAFTFRKCSFPPLSGMLLVWRSYVEHKVDTKEGKGRRIVFAYNFDPDSASQLKYERKLKALEKNENK